MFGTTAADNLDYRFASMSHDLLWFLTATSLAQRSVIRPMSSTLGFLDIAVLLKPKVMLLEIGDENQARRVLQLYFAHSTAKNSKVEIWRDWPDLESSKELSPFMDVRISEGDTQRVPVKGDGLIRSILIQSLDEQQ
ncbi:hypothetical protein CEP52_009812 [Fusarium oligoseptatum]|uniref:Uncharacterized protein n=1 Tax=Fusarium oligoseptatum TaxID=2604345 RepID=A0A428TBF7_9HYPO|nr:hypothetical protein CEP52_009812 [Fusarium oligoseptatum]